MTSQSSAYLLPGFYVPVLKLSTGYPFPYIYDETQEVAHAYKAACTPEFYLADANLNLVYHGQFDDSRPANGAPATGTSISQECAAKLCRLMVLSNMTIVQC